MSGAAVKAKLELRIDNHAPQILPVDDLKLWDGGGFENLGALPLIRRGIKNIIIVDAEEDSKYKFMAYKNLEKLLCPMGITLTVPQIEEFLQKKEQAKRDHTEDNNTKFYQHDVSVGTVTSTGATIDGKPIKSNIYYVKMSRLDSILVNYNKEAFGRGQALVASRDSAIECTKKRVCKCSAAPPLGTISKNDYNDYFVYFVNKYDQDRKAKKLKTWTFPQVFTIDQNLEPATMEALIGLGYLQGSELEFAQPR